MAVALAAAQRLAARSMRSNDLDNPKKRKIGPDHIESNKEIKQESALENVRNSDVNTTEASLINEKSNNQKRSTRSSITTTTTTTANSSPNNRVAKRSETENATRPASGLRSSLETTEKQEKIDQKQNQSQPSSSLEAVNSDPLTAQKDTHETSERDSAQQTTPPRRRESTRTRRPSSRMLPSPSPPPPRSSSYYNYLKSNSQPSSSAISSANVKSNTPNTNIKKAFPNISSNQISPIAIATADVGNSSAVGDISLESNSDENALGPGKRKRRPSTMTRPPTTITKGIEAEYDTSATSNPSSSSRSKGRSMSKSVGPEDKAERAMHVLPAIKSSQKKEKGENGQSTKVKSATSNGDKRLQDDVLIATGMTDAANESDCEFEKVKNSSKHDNSARKSQSKSALRDKGDLTIDSMRAQALSSGISLEPPPLISRRGGMKGSVTVHRQSSKSSHLQNSQHQTPPSTQKWSWDRSSVSVPLLRFKLDNLKPRSDEEDESAAEEEDDFHVAMLNGGDFDASSDCDEEEEEENVPRANTPSAKSSPRAYKSQDNSDIDDTPATTPQSPRSTCEGIERRNSTPEEDVKPRSRTVTRDAVFAHALEPSSNRPHTHAGALTLSLPFDEMPQPKDEEAVDEEPLSAGIVSKLLLPMMNEKKMVNALKVEENEVDRLPDGIDSAAVASELLGTSTVMSLDSVHRQMLSSPNPGSAFASPTISSTPLIKAEPIPLLLPPSIVGSKNNSKGSLSKLNESTRFESANSSDADEDDEENEDEENVFSQGAMVFGPPESVCLSELDRAWEQNEYLHQARKLAGAPIETFDSIVEEYRNEDHESQEIPSKKGGKRGVNIQVLDKEEDETNVKPKRSRTTIKQNVVPSPPSVRSSRRTTRKTS